MNRFRYARDPLCVAACGLYALNRWWLRALIGGVFLRGYFNDLLLIPAALPLALWLQRRLGLRPDDARPRWGEIALHFIVWSLAAELFAPRFMRWTTGDWRDVLAYGAGALVAGAWWHAAAAV